MVTSVETDHYIKSFAHFEPRHVNIIIVFLHFHFYYSVIIIVFSQIYCIHVINYILHCHSVFYIYNSLLYI